MANQQDISLLSQTLLGIIRGEDKQLTEADVDTLVEEMCMLPIFKNRGYSSEDKDRVSLRIKRSEGVTMQIGLVVLRIGCHS